MKTLSPIEKMIDAATGFDPAKHRPAKATLPDDAPTALLKVADTAEAWWREHRPKGWSLKKHLENPTVNITTPTHQRVAMAVARWNRLMGEFTPINKGEDGRARTIQQQSKTEAKTKGKPAS